MHDANLSRTNLTEANLGKADLRGSNLTEVDLSTADVFRAKKLRMLFFLQNSHPRRWGQFFLLKIRIFGLPGRNYVRWLIEP